jgi:hypothetical protein
MRAHLAIAALAMFGAAATGLSPSGAVEGVVFQWCMQPAARNTDCHYVTLEQCRAAASSQGFCFENPHYIVARQGKADRPRRQN